MFDFILTASRDEFLTTISPHTWGNGWANRLVRQFAQLFPQVCGRLYRGAPDSSSGNLPSDGHQLNASGFGPAHGINIGILKTEEELFLPRNPLFLYVHVPATRKVVTIQ